MPAYYPYYPYRHSSDFREIAGMEGMALLAGTCTYVRYLLSTYLSGATVIRTNTNLPKMALAKVTSTNQKNLASSVSINVNDCGSIIKSIVLY